MGAYGVATLQGNSFMSSGSVTFTPGEVGSSIDGLISRNEVIVNILKFLAMLFFWRWRGDIGYKQCAFIFSAESTRTPV